MHRIWSGHSNASQWFTGIIIAVGILLRFSQYLANRSLWLDESSLALNIVNRSFAQLLQPLDYDQGAPIGFLVVEKLAVLLLGNNEYALRLFPFVSGVVSLFLLYIVAKRYIKPHAIRISLGLFSLSSHLIYYSSELKQYSTDVAITLVLYGFSLGLERPDLVWGRVALAGVVGAAAVWFSYPAVFVLASIAGSLTLFCFARKQWGRLGRLLAAFSLWGASFAFHFIFLSDLANNRVLQDYWRGSFMPFPPHALADLEWFVNAFVGMFDNPVGLPLAGLAAFAFLAGGILMFIERKEKFVLLISPMLVTLLASGLHKYPFNGRLIMFLVPMVLLLVSEGVEQIANKTGSVAIRITLASLLFVSPLLSAYDNLIKPPTVEEIRPVMSYVREHYQMGDVLYVYYGARLAFMYYAKKYGLSDVDYILGNPSRDNWNSYVDELNRLRGNQRVWVLFSHVWSGNGVDEEELFLFLLDRRGTRLGSFNSPGAAVYLYNLN